MISAFGVEKAVANRHASYGFEASLLATAGIPDKVALVSDEGMIDGSPR
jgi:hypothetical protein